ncbi:glycosyl hydrolase family 28 protein [Bifidobacterium oedipodis]|uniref:Parallel beta-helix repeat-containing protein n=1 Tax=Bifidobacterium oedipodis TaxID=2675322 RepID=A0A7Y0EPL9_9BIFI|nr:glycosyl hydrolase family 28 protein [Bifidobacterium sp. DSM 109957]NMM94109.1 Parallel beta-helix repeat-containing protein [Bifidobacterium sp. DSM 109957]
MCTSASPRLAVYPAPAGARLSSDYVVKVRPLNGSDDDWQTLDLYRVRVDMHDPVDASMAYFDADFAAGAVEVEVSQQGWCCFYRADIRPLSLGVVPQVESRSVRFVVDRPVNLSVEVNRDRRHNLHLFVGDLAEVERMVADPDVVVEGNPNRPNTIDVVSAARGALADMAARPESERRPVKVLVRRAHYCVADCVMDLPSGLDVVLEGGVVIDGAFRVRHAHDVSVRGRGVFDLSGFKRFTGLSGLRVDFSHDVVVDGVTFVNPPHYTVMLGSSDGVAIRNVKSFSCEGWSDGVDMMACRRVEVEGCFLRTSDDCIAVYGSRWDYRGGTSDLTVRGCVLWADVAHPMMVGTHGDHEHDGDVLERLAFEDIDVLEHNEYQSGYLGVMAINAGDANTVRDVSWRRIRIEGFRRGRVLDIETKWNRDYNPRPGRLVERVLVEDVDVDAAGCLDEEPSLIRGYDAGHPVRGVTVRRMRRDGRVCEDFAQANIQVDGSTTQNTTIQA